MRPVVNPKIHAEWRDALTEVCARRNAPDAVVREVLRQLDLLVGMSDHVSDKPPGYVVPELGSHTKDAHLFWAAEQGGAEVIIVRDGHLEEVGSWHGIPILEPYHALRYLNLDPDALQRSTVSISYDLPVSLTVEEAGGPSRGRGSQA
ncbi:hypothetical protein [Geochorda subterranea]|uniref:hypothetical protein n=1 Tax=Geochorda subterranea TaxID=3109564 RepID=UPI0038602D44